MLSNTFFTEKGTILFEVSIALSIILIILSLVLGFRRKDIKIRIISFIIFFMAIHLSVSGYFQAKSYEDDLRIIAANHSILNLPEELEKGIVNSISTGEPRFNEKYEKLKAIICDNAKIFESIEPKSSISKEIKHASSMVEVIDILPDTPDEATIKLLTAYSLSEIRILDKINVEYFLSILIRFQIILLLLLFGFISMPVKRLKKR